LRLKSNVSERPKGDTMPDPIRPRFLGSSRPADEDCPGTGFPALDAFLSTVDMDRLHRALSSVPAGVCLVPAPRIGSVESEFVGPGWELAACRLCGTAVWATPDVLEVARRFGYGLEFCCVECIS
jgi:hypothetical protein